MFRFADERPPAPTRGWRARRIHLWRDVGFVLGLGCLALLWALGVYFPLRRQIENSHHERARLSTEINALAGDVIRLTKSEKLLENDDAYLWERIIRERLRWTRPGELWAPRSAFGGLHRGEILSDG